MYCKSDMFFFSYWCYSSSDNPLRFKENLLYIKDKCIYIYKLIMRIDDKIRDEKLQYDSNREAAKIALSSRKTDKYILIKMIE